MYLGNKMYANRGFCRPIATQHLTWKLTAQTQLHKPSRSKLDCTERWRYRDLFVFRNKSVTTTQRRSRLAMLKNFASRSVELKTFLSSYLSLYITVMFLPHPFWKRPFTRCTMIHSFQRSYALTNQHEEIVQYYHGTVKTQCQDSVFNSAIVAETVSSLHSALVTCM